MLDTNEFDSNSLEDGHRLVSDEDADEDENAEEVDDWVAIGEDALSIDKEVGLVATISSLTDSAILLYSELSVSLE